MSDTYKDHGHPPGWENEPDPRCQACAESELASSDGSLLLQGIESLIAEWTALAIEYDGHVLRHEKSGNLVAANVAEGRRKTWENCADDLRRLIDGQKEGNVATEATASTKL
jgi:hypothetical protein